MPSDSGTPDVRLRERARPLHVLSGVPGPSSEPLPVQEAPEPWAAGQQALRLAVSNGSHVATQNTLL